MKRTDYQQAFNAWDKTSEAMQRAIGDWFSLYYGAAGQDRNLRIAYSVVNKLTKTVFSEYTTGCQSPFYSRVLDALNDRCREAMQLALVGGECYIKPYPQGQGFRFSLIPRDQILVFSRDADGRPTDVGTAEKSTWGRFYYTLLERRSLDSTGRLTIENRLFRSLGRDTLGSPVALSDHPAYRELPVRYTYPEPLGGIGLVQLRTPMVNAVDGSREGVSVYAPAVELIRSIDRNEALLAGEFERGQSRVLVSRDLLDRDGDLTENLFVGLDGDPEELGVQIFAPQLREQSYLRRKQAILRDLETVMGLKRGMLSDVNSLQRTATEVSDSQGEYSLTVMDFQNMWADALRQVLSLCEKLAAAYGMEAGETMQVTVDWGNGVLYDQDALWLDYKDMVAKGLIAPEVALGWRFGMAADTDADRTAIRRKYMPG